MSTKSGARLQGELIAPAEEDVADDGESSAHAVGHELIEINDEAEEAEPLRIAPSPKQPTSAEVELHRITHWPYRSWCEECVKGRGLGEQRGRHVGRAHSIPIVGLDYSYIT